MPKQHRSGFTLIELLVVIMIAASLAALLFPVFAQARERAHSTTCLAHLSQLAKAEMMYVDDYDERFPNWYLGQRPPRPAPFDGLIFWPELFQPYVRGAQIFQDPEFRWFLAPRAGELKLADYTMFTGGAYGHGTPDNPYWRWAGPSLTLAQLQRPGETILMMDGFTTTQRSVFSIWRHHRGAYAVFHDGHTRWFREQEFYRVDTDARGFVFRHYAAADR
jgi:prepilin-type N-terminal cleavage/methylation domain-containing protein